MSLCTLQRHSGGLRSFSCAGRRQASAYPLTHLLSEGSFLCVSCRVRGHSWVLDKVEPRERRFA